MKISESMLSSNLRNIEYTHDLPQNAIYTITGYEKTIVLNQYLNILNITLVYEINYTMLHHTADSILIPALRLYWLDCLDPRREPYP